jgi:hypothetical protein
MRPQGFAAIALSILLYGLACGLGATVKAAEQPLDPSVSLPDECKDFPKKASCFNSSKIVDRIIYCTNNRAMYVFVNETFSDLAAYCMSLPRHPDRKDERKPSTRGFDSQFLSHIFSTRECNTADRRVVNSDIVEKVLHDPRLGPGRWPIALIGAIFCDELNVVGFDLKRSLVFDHSVFLQNVLIRNFTSELNLSFNDVRAGQTITVIRAHLKGGLFANEADINSLEIVESTADLSVDLARSLYPGMLKIERTKSKGNLGLDDVVLNGLEIHDSEIGANLTLKRAILLAAARVDRSEVHGGLDTTDAAFSLLQARYNKFDTNVEMRASEFRCGLELSKNQIASDLLLFNVSLGRTIPAPPGGKPQNTWSEQRTEDIGKRIDGWVKNGHPPSTLDNSSNTDCAFEKFQIPAEARINDNRIDKNLCVETFGFRASPSTSGAQVGAPAAAQSYLSLNGTIVTSNSFLAIGPQSPANPTADRTSNYTIELLGFQTGGLIIPFDDDTRKSFELTVTGVKFDRIFDGDVSCQYREAGGGGQGTKRIKLPTSAQLVAWLAKSKSPEAHAAAIDALQRAGTDATALKVAKAEIEWRNDRDLQRQLLDESFQKWRAERAEAWNERKYLKWATLYFAPLTWTNQIFDLIRSEFIRLFGIVSDYGFRPYKIVLFVIGFIILCRLFISLLLGVKKAVSEKTNETFKVGWLFIIDHMVPFININDDHAKVARYLDRNQRPIGPRRKRVMNHTVRAMKFVGTVAAIFVAASLKALIVG